MVLKNTRQISQCFLPIFKRMIRLKDLKSRRYSHKSKQRQSLAISSAFKSGLLEIKKTFTFALSAINS